MILSAINDLSPILPDIFLPSFLLHYSIVFRIVEKILFGKTKKPIDIRFLVWYFIGAFGKPNGFEGGAMRYNFNYGLLKQRIKDEYGTYGKFAAAMGTTSNHMSDLLNGKAKWNPQTTYQAAELLGIVGQIETFFFAVSVRKNKQR